MYKGFEHGEVLLQHLTKHLTNTSPTPHQHLTHTPLEVVKNEE